MARIRSRIDSLLHPFRRRQAHERLKRFQPRNILVVCQGNICRSPFAASLLANRVPPEFAETLSITSAGFVGPGRPSPDYALSTARSYGVDMTPHRSSVLTSDRLQQSDLVVVMSAQQERGVSARIRPGTRVVVLGDLDPLPITRRTILDPWDGPESAFAESYSRIERCIRELVKLLWGQP